MTPGMSISCGHSSLQAPQARQAAAEVRSFVGHRGDGENVGRPGGGQALSAGHDLGEPRDLAGRRDVLVSAPGGLEVHHQPAHPGARKGEGVQPAVHCLQGEASREHVRRLVVGPADHQDGEVAPGEAHAVAELLQDAAAPNAGQRRAGRVGEVEATLARLPVELVEQPGFIELDIPDPDLCGRYSAALSSGVTISP